MNATEVLNCLRLRYAAPEWAFAEELSLIPGFIRGRRADAVAINCFCSGKWGLAFLGFEVKVSRGDFLHELKHPQKRLETYIDVDGIFFATPKGMVKKEEVPEDCGLIECWTKKIKDDTIYSTRIQKYPKGFQTPMEKMNNNATLNLNDAGPISRAVSVAMIRGFDPNRINQETYLKSNRLEYELKDAKGSLRYVNENLKNAEAELEAYRTGTRADCPKCPKEAFKSCKNCDNRGWIKKEN